MYIAVCCLASFPRFPFLSVVVSPQIAEMGGSINGGTPSYHPFLDGIFPYKPSIWGYHHYWKPPYNDLWMNSSLFVVFFGKSFGSGLLKRSNGQSPI